mmetsp:Transcript_25841/g.50328  ORF Transcript_25841/g.50328 Transcript_25841/m.50328 type:complete len:204 (+) Transcript_25841:83-694(+)
MASTTGKREEPAPRYTPRPSPLALLSQRECIRSRWIDAKASVTTTSSEGGADTASIVSLDDTSSRCSSGSKRKGMSVEVNMSKRIRYCSKSAGSSPRILSQDPTFIFSGTRDEKNQVAEAPSVSQRASLSDSPRIITKATTFSMGSTSKYPKPTLPTILSNGSIVEPGGQGVSVQKELTEKETYEAVPITINIGNAEDHNSSQ